MFKKIEQISCNKIETVIGSNSFFKGDISSKGSIRIDGKLEGSILDSSAVILGKNAEILGDVVTGSMILGGNVFGNVSVNGLLEILAGAKVKGDIKAGTLSLAQGASFEGCCSMSANKKEGSEVSTK